jgi:Holliday junction resolvase
VVRSAGSKGLVDLVALKPSEVLLVQCKSNTLTKEERTRLLELKQRLGYRVMIALRKDRKVVLNELT